VLFEDLGENKIAILEHTEAIGVRRVIDEAADGEKEARGKTGNDGDVRQTNKRIGCGT
jgi:hypothetical protein